MYVALQLKKIQFAKFPPFPPINVDHSFRHYGHFMSGQHCAGGREDVLPRFGILENSPKTVKCVINFATDCWGEKVQYVARNRARSKVYSLGKTRGNYSVHKPTFVAVDHVAVLIAELHGADLARIGEARGGRVGRTLGKLAHVQTQQERFAVRTSWKEKDNRIRNGNCCSKSPAGDQWITRELAQHTCTAVEVVDCQTLYIIATVKGRTFKEGRSPTFEGEGLVTFSRRSTKITLCDTRAPNKNSSVKPWPPNSSQLARKPFTVRLRRRSRPTQDNLVKIGLRLRTWVRLGENLSLIKFKQTAPGNSNQVVDKQYPTPA